VKPLLFRPRAIEQDEGPIWQPSDLNLIEIISSKCYRIGDTAVQSNYLVCRFSDFFASDRRARAFWNLAWAERVNTKV
jgi:hypothetical protein